MGAPAGHDAPPTVTIVDWELCGRGDPAWDVATVLAGYLSAWLFSIRVGPDAAPDAGHGAAGRPLEEMRPAIRACWRAYAGGLGLGGDEARSRQVRVARFAAARLVQTAFEAAEAADRLSAGAVLHLQVASNMLEGPSDGASALLGLEPDGTTRLLMSPHAELVAGRWRPPGSTRPTATPGSAGPSRPSRRETAPARRTPARAWWRLSRTASTPTSPAAASPARPRPPAAAVEAAERVAEALSEANGGSGAGSPAGRSSGSTAAASWSGGMGCGSGPTRTRSGRRAARRRSRRPGGRAAPQGAAAHVPASTWRSATAGRRRAENGFFPFRYARQRAAREAHHAGIPGRRKSKNRSCWSARASPSTPAASRSSPAPRWTR